ncbi:cytochrome c oxidase subunit I [Xenophilus arseniciresistens]|uniref:cytochrome-c oxidase n=1 Tax=Xenophilus arseniciresistens TaxID=1283306 RepID=A0AAE3N6U5_9BURK|nr:cytochrome c oxidase subunit I [Xenophilus arseniciresistens]MDA7415017.1 cytochrome c oxidase subunit I [Xenophilus arseniciresistens]
MPEEGRALRDALHAVWRNPPGWRTLAAVNHGTIALRFMLTAAFFFVVAGVLAMLLRAQLALPGHDFMGPGAYNQAFTMHGTLMMFLFAVPVLQGLAAYLLPKMLGARDLVFPRLSAFGYWCYLFGGLIFTSSLVFELAPDAGWFMYTPLSSNRYSPGINADFWLIGITFVEIATLAAGIELAVSILRTRAAGMALQKMPIFAWSMLVTSLMIVIGFPPLVLGSLLLELERAAGWAFFDPTRGGDPLLWAHLFWLFGHPEVYIIFLPAAGVISTLVPVFAGRPLVGYVWVVASLIGVGFLSFGLWVHHMFTLGIPALAQAFFSAASMLVGVPTAVQLFAWIATLWTGRPRWEVPMLWIGAFLLVFVAGGLTGVMLALVPFNWQVHDTHFVVAHFHYVLVGGMLFPLLAGLYHWLPHVSGRMPSRRLARAGFWLTFIGFNGTFLVMHWTGLLGMPRRVYTYEAGLGWELPNLVSSVFGFVMAFGIVTVLIDLALHWRLGARAGVNPWGASTLEWATATPPEPYNFASQAPVRARHPLWARPALPQEMAEGAHALARADAGRETLGSSAVAARPTELIVLPGNSWLPLQSAALLALLCVLLLCKLYLPAAAVALLVLVQLLRWSWVNGEHPAYGAAQGGAPAPLVVDGRAVRPHTHGLDGPGHWGMNLSLLADGALYGALLFGWFYLWTVAPQWQAPARPMLGPGAMGGVLAPMLAGVLLLWRVRRGLARGHARHAALQLALTGVLGLAATLALAALLWQLPLQPRRTAHDAVLAVALIYLGLHALVAGLLALMQAARVQRGWVGVHRPYEPRVVAAWWHYSAGATAVAWLAFSLAPMGFAP